MHKTGIQNLLNELVELISHYSVDFVLCCNYCKVSSKCISDAL